MKKAPLFRALLIALAISAVFTLWLSKRLPRATPAHTVAMRRVVTVTRDLPAGDILQPGSLQTSDWVTSQSLPGAFSVPAEVAGRALLYPLSAGEVVLAHQLAPPGVGSGLMVRIPTGMRAISMHADEISGVAGFLLPGSSVDVLVTYHPPDSPDPVTLTVLQGVYVLATRRNTEAGAETKQGNPDAVTLLVSPQNAEKLTQAASLGKIVFVLRNAADHEQTPGLNAALAAPVTPTPTARHAASQPPNTSFSVQTIAGNKQTEELFSSDGTK